MQCLREEALDQVQLLYEREAVNGISSDSYYAIALPSCVGWEGKWEGRAAQINPLTSLAVNQSFKCELIWCRRKPGQRLTALDCRFCRVQILYVCGNWASSALGGFGVACAAMLRVT